MKKIHKRLLDLTLPRDRSAFLWGPRQVGKSWWIQHALKPAHLIDLLRSEEFSDYASRPSLLRERLDSVRGLVVIDEIQKVPALLNEIHWLIENRHVQFLMTGSSSHKLRRENANLLGGRAWRRTMTPLSCLEVQGFDLEDVMVSGLLPRHYLSTHPLEDLRGYVADYLKEEIAAEARVNQIPSFSEFLRVAALTSRELLDYTQVAREAGISQRTVRAYFDILEDSYLGFRIAPWKKSPNRRMIQAEKFYLFDVGITHYLTRSQPKIGSPEFGKAFEHYILMELRAYQAYRQPEMPISFWRTSTGQEVDFILGDKLLAVEVKSSARVHESDIRTLSTLSEDGPVKAKVVVSLERQARRLATGVEILPYRQFLEKLWSGQYIS